MKILLLTLSILPITILSGCGNRPTNTVTTNDTTKLYDTLTSESAKACNITNLQTDIPTNKDTVIASLSEIISSPPTSKELDQLSNTITQRLLSLSPDSPLRQNLSSLYTTPDSLVLSLSINTPYWQNQYRQQLSDSPYIKFVGPSQPEKITITHITGSVADSITLQSDLPSYPASSSTVSFTLTNNTHSTLEFGDPYTVAYRATDSVWYKLPGGGIWNDICYAMKPGGSHTFNVRLYPHLNRNNPGIYRLYKKVKSEDTGKPFWIMTEFQLH